MASRPLAVAAAVSVGAAGARVDVLYGPDSSWLAFADWAVGAAFAFAAIRLRDQDRTAAAISLLLAATWYLGTCSAAPGVLGRIGIAMVLVYRAPLLHLLALTARTRAAMALTLMAYVVVLAPSGVAGPATVAVAAAIGIESIRKSLHAAADRRRRLRLAAVAAFGVALTWVGGIAGVIPSHQQSLLLDVVLVGVAWLVVRNVGRAPILDALSELLVDLGPGSGPAPAPISAKLAEALGSPGLFVLYHPPGMGWVDELGRAAVAPAPGGVRAMTPDGGEVALVDGSRDLRESELAQGAAASAGLAFAGARLAAEARLRAQATRASRRRLLVVGDSERRGIEQRLRDGPLTRLATVRELLEAAPAASASSLAREYGAALMELETLARGLYPSRLLEAPLDDVLRELLADVDLPAEVTVNGPAERLDVSRRALAYFVCAECVTNVSRHAPTASLIVRVDVTDAELRVGVTDDGPGGATIHARGGLQGLSDRVATMGGDFEIVSPIGGPTCIRVTLPASEAHRR